MKNALLMAMGWLAMTTWHAVADGEAAAQSPYGKWRRGPPTDPAFFPIGVFWQTLENAARYKDAGINLYVRASDPTEAGLSAARQAGMRLMPTQKAAWLTHKDDPLIIGWTHDNDEPDNAKSFAGYWRSDLAAIGRAWPEIPIRENWGKWGPPVPPADVVARYRAATARDTSRPVFLTLGQGVANDLYVGRGARKGRLDDYPRYMEGADILSFDIYPGSRRDTADIGGKLWLTAKGMARLVKWTEGRKPAWGIIEASFQGSESKRRATPDEVRTQVWMSLIHGALGIVYFVHQSAPKFVEAGLLSPAPEDVAVRQAVTALNRQIAELAPVLNGPTLPDAARVSSSVAASEELAAAGLAPIASMAKRHGGALYLFAVRMEDTPARASFTLCDVPPKATVDVLGEGRRIEALDGRFDDDFAGYQVHIYKVAGR